MSGPQTPMRRKTAKRNIVAIDGTLDRFQRLELTVKEVGKNSEPFDLRIVHKEAVREHVDCNSPECFNGGFSLGEVLRDMIRSRQEEFIGTSFCTGQEGDPEDLGPHPSCSTRFELQLTLRYR